MMLPEEMIYTAQKVNEWTEGVVQREMPENTTRQKQPKKEKRLRREAENDALRSMIHRQIRLSANS